MQIQSYAVGAQVDTSSLMRAMELAQESSTQKLTKLIRNTAFYTAKHAYDQTKALPMGWIDMKMEVDVISYTNATRARLSRAKRGTKFTETPASKFLPAKAVPLGVLIIMARHRAGSNWNLQTDHRWSLAGAVLPTGTGTAAARQRQIADELTRMVRSRHSSTGFIRKGWSDCIRRIKRLGAVDGGFSDAGGIESGAGRTAQLGDATAGRSGALVWLEIENDIGLDESYPKLSARRQKYLFEVGGLALEAAVILQVRDMQAHYLPKVAGELESEWNAL